jgi:hypothetical protein
LAPRRTLARRKQWANGPTRTSSRRGGAAQRARLAATRTSALQCGEHLHHVAAASHFLARRERATTIQTRRARAMRFLGRAPGRLPSRATGRLSNSGRYARPIK